MNVKNKTIRFCIIIGLCICLANIALSAESANELVSQGNQLYKAGDFNEAILNYDKAINNAPDAAEPKFNKADSFYRLDDLSQAMELYRQTASDSKDMSLVAKSKYNLGNSHFENGKKQAGADIQKAIEQMKTAIGYWRGVLDIEPDNEKAVKNIEVAKLTIKDLLEQQKNQQQDPNQCRDPNQPQDPNQSQQQNQQQQQSPSDSNEPNQPQQQQNNSGEPNQPQDQKQQDQQQEQQEQQQQDEQEKEAPDTTAQDILDKEQKQRQERQMMQQMRYQKVEMDW